MSAAPFDGCQEYIGGRGYCARPKGHESDHALADEVRLEEQSCEIAGLRSELAKVRAERDELRNERCQEIQHSTEAMLDAERRAEAAQAEAGAMREALEKIRPFVGWSKPDWADALMDAALAPAKPEPKLVTQEEMDASPVMRAKVAIALSGTLEEPNWPPEKPWGETRIKMDFAESEPESGKEDPLDKEYTERERKKAEREAARAHREDAVYTESMMDAAIIRARREERERCAKAVEDFEPTSDTCKRIAAAIRALPEVAT